MINMEEGSGPYALYKQFYKDMSTFSLDAELSEHKGETTVFMPILSKLTSEMSKKFEGHTKNIRSLKPSNLIMYKIHQGYQYSTKSRKGNKNICKVETMETPII